MMGVRIWVNRVLGALNSDNKPLYKMTPVIVGSQTLYSLELANPILQAPTLHNAGNMNNLFNFRNLLAMGNTEYTTTDWSGNTVIETIKDKTTKVLVAKLVTVKVSEIQRTETEQLYNIDGVSVIQERKATWTKSGQNWSIVIV